MARIEQGSETVMMGKVVIGEMVRGIETVYAMGTPVGDKEQLPSGTF